MTFRHPVQHERRLQAAVIRWARSNAGLYPPLRWLFAIPNGGHRDVLEAAWLKNEGVTAGVFDLCLLYDNGEYPTLWIEMKHGKNTLTDDQREFQAWAESQGHQTAVCYTTEAAIAQLRDYLGIDDPGLAIARDVIAAEYSRLSEFGDDGREAGYSRAGSQHRNRRGLRG